METTPSSDTGEDRPVDGSHRSLPTSFRKDLRGTSFLLNVSMVVGPRVSVRTHGDCSFSL